MAELPEIANLRRWRDVGDVDVSYAAGSKQFADDVIALLREYERLQSLLRDIAALTYDGPMRSKINAELR